MARKSKKEVNDTGFVQVQIRVKPDKAKKLDSIATETGRLRNDLIREAIDMYLKSKE